MDTLADPAPGAGVDIDPDHLGAAHELETVDMLSDHLGADIAGAGHANPGENLGKGEDAPLLHGAIGAVLVAHALKPGVRRKGGRSQPGCQEQ